ncbi:MAG: sulfurtransferase [Thermodesulfobacteriota bacterium]|nr:MAG: sulfurtransferase [Thermodesulfobacteriota bacterium]
MGYANPDILVSPHWLHQHKDDPNLVIVDCPWEYYSYTRAHIPGAVCRPEHAYIKNVDEELGQTVLVADLKEVEKLCMDLGIGADSTVVAYDEWGSIFATRFWWVLGYYGFNKVKVLDGGWQNWVSSGLPISFTSSKPKEITNRVKLKANPEMLVTIDELLQKYDNPSWQVLDVRSADEYHGHAAHGNTRIGHVPGAIHFEWDRLFENSKDAEGIRPFKSADDIEAFFNSARIDSSKNIVTHCQAAVRATLVAFALELIGYGKVKVYDGSMAEWANRDDTPLE